MTDRLPDAPNASPRLSLIREIDFRPLVLPACAFIIGILLYRFVPIPTLAVVVIAAALVLLFPVVYLLTKRSAVVYALVMLLAVTCGYLRSAYRNEALAPDDVSRLVAGPDGALLRVRGFIATRPRVNATQADGTFQRRDFVRTRFDLEVDSVETQDGWQPASGTVQVNVYDRADDFAYGDRIAVFSRFTRPEGPTSDGQFDYRTYLQRHGIRLRTSLSSREALGAVIEHHRGNLLLEVAHAIGARLARIVNDHHSPREAGLLRCILLGERGAVDAETERTFRMSGLSHLLTVSGLHVMVLLGGLWIAMRFLLVPEKVSAAIIIVAAVLYAAMAGLQPSVVRATVVMVIVAAGLFVGRRPDMLNALAVAVLVLLVANPDEVFFAGFQLSFISVLGLVALAPGLYNFLRERVGMRGLDLLPGAYSWLRVKANTFLLATFAMTTSVWLAGQLLVAYHFNVLNPITLGVNLLLMPLFGAILLIAFFVLIVETLLGGFLIASVSDALVTLLLGLSNTASRLPGAWVNFPSPPVWVLCVYYALLALTALAPTLGLRRRRPAIAVLVVLCALVVFELRPARPETAELVILDVGQGSAALVRSGEGHTALVDAGSTGGDCARWTIIPYLITHRIRTLDAVLLSHADVDHISGLPGLVANFTVRKVLLSEDFKHTPTGARVERFLIDRGVAFDYVATGDRVALGSVQLEVLHPPRDRTLLREWTRNERSAVVRGVTPGGTFLLFGDASKRGFWHLAARNDLKADVALAAHHGGISGMEKLAADLRWPVVLFSAGKGFIRPEKRDAYRHSGARTFATCENGTLRVRFGETITVDTFNRRKAR